MKKRILIACDLEGVNNVVGEPYSGLYRGCEQWEIARRQAALEINAAAAAFFELGAECVDLWDNHGGGNNIDAQDLDRRIGLLSPDPSLPRMYFIEHGYDCVCFFGYHAMEGTLGGVLAHTMNSKEIQYYKLNGVHIGEIDMDAYIAASYGVPSCLFVGGDIACAQASRAVPGIATVVTKREISRNEAEFRDNGELLSDIGAKISEVVRADVPIRKLEYPAVMAKSFKRTEDAAKYLKRLLGEGIAADHPRCEIRGKDAHTVEATVYGINDFIKCI
ncbi:MAG: M55 family metallopeptidase [Clostridia bacterium]|nr:M55 family metallopeptidase [Clostridia bacterium]